MTAAQKYDGANAVWDFDDWSLVEPGYHELDELLANKVIETLIEFGNLTVVDRNRLILALEELNLSTTSTVSDPPA